MFTRRRGVGVGRRGGFRGLGGASPATFNPASLGTAIGGWNFDVANVVKDGSDRISQLNDLSGGTAHMVQAVTFPLWVANVLNGKAVGRFSAAGLENMAATHAGDKAQPNTIYAVADVTATALTKCVFDSGTVGKLQELYYDASEQPTLYAGSALTWASAQTSWLAWCADFNTTSSNLYVNDFTTARASGTTNTNVMGANFRLGSTYFPSSYFDGDIAEVWVFTGSHTQTQKNLMRDYLNTRYALAIT